MNINDWMIENKIAKNSFNANAIFYGLELHKINNDEMRMKRCRLYRDWRKSGIYKDTKSCFEKAIAGEEAPMLELEATE